MSKQKRPLEADTDVLCVISATPVRPSLESYNGNSSGKKYPEEALHTSLQRIKKDMKQAGIEQDTTPTTIMTFFGQKILDSSPVQRLYDQNKSFLLKKRAEDLLKITTTSVGKIEKTLKTSSLGGKLLDLYKTKQDAFILCMQNKEIDVLSVFLGDIALNQNYSIPNHHLRICKVELLTKAFDIVIQPIKQNPNWKPSRIDFMALSKKHTISAGLLEACYNKLNTPNVNVGEFGSKYLADCFHLSIDVDQQGLQRQYLAHLLHKEFHAAHKKYYQGVAPTTLLANQEFAEAPHSAKVFAHTLLTHRASAFLMADGHVGDELYSGSRYKYKTHSSSFTYEATSSSVTECNKVHWTGSKTSMLPSLRTYDKIAKKLRVIAKTTTDPEIAESMMDILCGRAPKIYNDKSPEAAKELEFLSRVTHLLFSTEVSRNKSALITNAMFLDLVKSGTYKMSDIVNLPMSLQNAVMASRTLSAITSNSSPGHRKYDQSEHKAEPDSKVVRALLARAENICSDWAKLRNAEDVVDEIFHSIQGWFGINIDPIQEVSKVIDFSVFLDEEVKSLGSAPQDAA